MMTDKTSMSRSKRVKSEMGSIIFAGYNLEPRRNGLAYDEESALAGLAHMVAGQAMDFGINNTLGGIVFTCTKRRTA